MSGEVKISTILRNNNVKHHLKKAPMFDKEGVAFYEKKLSEGEVVEKLVRSRTNVEIELNPHLAVVVKPLQRAFPQAKIFCLMRNPKECVRDWMKLGIFHNGEKRIFKGVAHFSEFEKCCFLWNSTYDFMLEEMKGLEILRSEDVTYESLEKLFRVPLKKVAQVLSVDIPFEWKEAEWDTFEKICGKKMREFGYV